MDESSAVQSGPPGEPHESSEAHAAAPSSSKARPRARAPWAAEALAYTALAGIVAKVCGTLVAPGLRGVASQRIVEGTSLVAASTSYVFAGLVVALLSAGTFAFARAPKVSATARALLVGTSGLVVAIASPALIDRLPLLPLLACALCASLVALIAAGLALKLPETRAMGGVLLFFGLAALTRPAAWTLVRSATEHASLGPYEAARIVGIAGIVLRTLGVVVSATWLATRSKWKDRLLVNVAFLLSFAVSYVVIHDENAPSRMLVAVLRGSLVRSSDLALAFDATPVAIFLVSASILLAIVGALQRTMPARALALILVSGATLDVPLHALAITAAAPWVLLSASRYFFFPGVQQPTSALSPNE